MWHNQIKLNDWMLNRKTIDNNHLLRVVPTLLCCNYNSFVELTSHLKDFAHTLKLKITLYYLAVIGNSRWDSLGSVTKFFFHSFFSNLKRINATCDLLRRTMRFKAVYWYNCLNSFKYYCILKMYECSRSSLSLFSIFLCRRQKCIQKQHTHTKKTDGWKE